MSDKVRGRIKFGVPYIITFICGILFLLLILKVKEYQEIKAYVEVSPTIAIVNQDVIDDSYNFSFGDKIVSMFLDNSEYSFVLTNYQDATEGVKGYAYSGYILIDSNFTSSMYSINDEIPTKGKISYKINSNLDNNESQRVEDYILSQLYIVNNNINYLYITSIIEVLHGSQDNIDDVLSNEDEVDNILTNIDNSNSRYYNSSNEFLKEAAKEKDDNEIEPVEIDPNSLVDIQYNTDELVKLSKDISSDYEEGLKGNANNLANVYSEYGKIIMKGSFDINNLNSDEIYLSFLNNEVDKLSKVNKLVQLSNIIYDGVDSLDLSQYVLYVEDIDKLYDDTVPNSDGVGDVVDFSTNMSKLRDDYQVVIVDFIKNYHYWVTNPDQTCPDINNLPDDITAPDYTTRYNCMADFKVKYKDSKIIQDYIKLKNIYLKVVDLIGTDRYNEVIAKYDTYVENLEEAEYTEYVSSIPSSNLADSYKKTDELCDNVQNNNNIVVGFSCEWEDTLTWLLSDSINVIDSNKKEILNEVVLQDVEIARLMGNRENKLISNYLNTYPILGSATVSGVENIISEDGVTSIESSMNIQQGANKGLQETIVNNEILDQENINQITKSFKAKYPELTTGLDENSNLLYEFATLFENSNNAEGANYFLYDFVSNPVQVSKESSSGKLIPIKQEVDKSKIAILATVGIILVISSGIYYDLRKKYKHKGEDEDEYLF